MQRAQNLIISLAFGTKWLSGAVAGIAMLLLCSDVVIRYFFPYHLADWTTEVVTYLVVWALFLVACELAIEGKHVHADLFVDRLSTRARYRIALVASMFGLIFSLLFLTLGVDVVAFSVNLGEESDSTLRIPKSLYYAALPVGMALQLLGYVVRMRTTMIEHQKSNPTASNDAQN